MHAPYNCVRLTSSNLYRGLPVDRANCPYDASKLANRVYMRSSMLTNPFEKFERKRFMYYSKDLGQISMNHALTSRLAPDDYATIREQQRADLSDYYARLPTQVRD